MNWNRANVLKVVAQSRHANINTVLDYGQNQRLFVHHAGFGWLGGCNR